MAASSSTRAVGRCIAAVAGGGRSRAPVIGGGGDSRKAHSSSAYDKEIEEEVRPAVVPDHVLNSSKYYWGPHPQTGVFGPETTGGAGGGGSAAAAVKETPAPEQTVRFRTLEDVDKAPYL